MHLPTTVNATPPRPPVAYRLGAVMALLLTPAIGYALGRIAWEQALDVFAGGHVLATLTLGQVLAPVAAGAGAVIAAHLTLTTLVVLVTPRTSRLRAAAAGLTPSAWRRLITIATTGTLSIALAVPATATTGAIPIDNTDAGWVSTPVEATSATPAANPQGAEQTPTSASSHQPTRDAEPTRASDLVDVTRHQADATGAHEVVVAVGDTLWDITATQLDVSADNHGAIAQAWPELYEENRDVIGDDPGLIVPDQRLTVPQGWSA